MENFIIKVESKYLLFIRCLYYTTFLSAKTGTSSKNPCMYSPETEVQSKHYDFCNGRTQSYTQIIQRIILGIFEALLENIIFYRDFRMH